MKFCLKYLIKSGKISWTFVDLWFISFLTLHLFRTPLTLADYGKKGEIQRIWSLAGERVDVPCEATPRAPGDKPNLVLWYKDYLKKPIYTFDARNVAFPSGDRWSNETVFNNRAYFVSTSKPPSLAIEPTLLSDEGTFICRLDYHNSPTTSFKVYLQVLALPDPPEIYWNGHHVYGPIGPLKENSLCKFSCVTKGGKPPPSLIWWLEGHQLLDQVQQVEESGTTRSFLSIKATREVNMKTLSCHTQVLLDGVSVSRPLIASVLLNITLAPLGISIEGSDGPITAGTTYALQCISWGSHPPAEVHWWKSGKEMTDLKSTIRDGGNVTTSELKVVVTEKDDGASFTCRTSNPDLPDPPLTEGRRLIVTYKPSVDLRLKVSSDFISDRIDESGRAKMISVKQGSDVLLECTSQSNPPPRYLEWLQNGIIIETGEEAWSLLLPNVGRKQSGSYACSATNEVGRGFSPSYNLIVEHSPECARGWLERTHGAELNKSVTVLCRVEALPSRGLNFTWMKLQKNNRKVEFDPLKIQTDGTTSRLTFVPSTLEDFGTFFCRAKNSAGIQEVPCKITLVPASPPDQPFNCSSEPGKSPGALTVTCLEGFNGGFPQRFALVALQDGKVIMNITRDFPEWFLEGLQYGKGATLRIAAFNTRGSSQALRLEVFLAKPPPDSTPHGPNVSEIEDQRMSMPLIGIFVGTGGVLVLALMVIAILFYTARRHFIPVPKVKLRSLAADKQSHTILVTSAANLSSSKFVSDPDVVTCIRSDSKASLYKVLDVVPSQSQAQPLINHHGSCTQTPDYESSSSTNTSSSSMRSSFNGDAEITDLTEAGRTETLSEVGAEHNLAKENPPYQDGFPMAACCDAVYVDWNKDPLSIACIANEVVRNQASPLYENDRIFHEKEYSDGGYYENCDKPLLFENLRSNSVDAIHYRNCGDKILFQPYSYNADPCRNCNCNSQISCKNSRSVDEFYASNKHLKSNNEQRLASLIKDLQRSSSKGEITEIPYEDIVIFHRNIQTPPRHKNEKKYKRWTKGCGTCMCSGKNHIDTLERPLKAPLKQSSFDNYETSTYKKFDGLCPCEIGIKASTGNLKEPSRRTRTEIISNQQINDHPLNSTEHTLKNNGESVIESDSKDAVNAEGEEQLSIANSVEMLDKSIQDLKNQRIYPKHIGFSRSKTRAQITNNALSKKPPIAQRNKAKDGRRMQESEAKKGKTKGHCSKDSDFSESQGAKVTTKAHTKDEPRVSVENNSLHDESRVTFQKEAILEDIQNEDERRSIKRKENATNMKAPLHHLSNQSHLDSPKQNNHRPDEKPQDSGALPRQKKKLIKQNVYNANLEPQASTQRKPQETSIRIHEKRSKLGTADHCQSNTQIESTSECENKESSDQRKRDCKKPSPFKQNIKPKIQLRELSSSPLHRKRQLSRLEKVRKETNSSKNEADSHSIPLNHPNGQDTIPNSPHEHHQHSLDRHQATINTQEEPHYTSTTGAPESILENQHAGKVKDDTYTGNPLVSFSDKCKIDDYLPLEDSFRIETEGLAREIENLENIELDKIFQKCTAFSSTESLPVAVAEISDPTPAKNLLPLKSILRNSKDEARFESN